MKSKLPKPQRLMIVIGLLLGFKISAQQLPNIGFENWESKTFNNITFQQPQGWFTLNQLKAFGYEETTYESSEAKVGIKAVMLETIVGPFNTLPGLLLIQNILGQDGMPDLEKNKVPFQGLPGGFSFYYKSGPEVGDANVILMVLTKWKNGKRDTIGIASFETDSTVDNYTYAIVPVIYQIENELPDSMSFIASSSKNGFSPVAGSWFLIDQLQLFYTDALKEQNASKLKIYPNPVNEMVCINGLKNDLNFKIYNAQGSLVMSGKTKDSKVFGLNQLINGNYFLQLSDETTNSIHQLIINHLQDGN